MENILIITGNPQLSVGFECKHWGNTVCAIPYLRCCSANSRPIHEFLRNESLLFCEKYEKK